MDLFLNKYKELRDKVDAKIKELEPKHKKHMLCKAGCSSCCMEYAILPVEFEAVKNSIKGKSETNVNVDYGIDECPFLVDHKCGIYEDRPIICRTHGLPLLFMGDDEWELSACDLNFTKVPEDYFSFENTFQQDSFNSQLYVLNQSFHVGLKTDKKGDEKQLISIQELAKNL